MKIMQEYNFEKRDIKRAVRDIEASMEDILNDTGRIMFHTNIKRFVNLIESNYVLRFLTEPFTKLNVDFIEKDDCGWIDLNIPVCIDYQIAYVLSKFKEFSKSDDRYCIHNFLYSVYKQSSGDDNAYRWNNSIVKPCFRELLFRLNDLIEDLPSEEEVNVKYMSIINVGNITNSNGNLAIGDKITQNNNSTDLFKDIIKLVNENIDGDEKEEVLNVVNELKDNQGKPSFKTIIPKFIAATAKYGPIFIGMWEQLQNM